MNEIAGSEQDVLIHTKIFGHPRNVPVMCDPGFLYRQTEAGWVKYSAPTYSNDISAAWTVVEKMREKSRLIIDHDGLSWVVHFTDIPDVRAIASADTAPEAICRAALAAME